MAGFALPVTSGAFTLVGSHSVDTVASSTQTWNGLALIHILAGPGADVRDEASSAGVRLGRTLLTGVTPRSPNGGAAKGFSANDPAELALAHLVVHLGKAWPSPVVSLALRASETVNTGTSAGSDAAPTVLAAVLTHRLSTVVSCESLWTGAAVFCAAASVHTPDVAGLNSCSTAGRELPIGTGTHVGSGTEAIAA